MKPLQTKKGVSKYTVISILTIVLLIVAWQAAVDLHWIRPGKVAAPTAIFKTFLQKLSDPAPDGHTLLENTWQSLKLALGGFLTAALVGIPLGLLMGFFPAFEKIARPIFEMLRPIPPLAWVPIILLLLGIGDVAKTVIIFVGCFVAIVINCYTGIVRTNPVFINVAKTAGASKWQIFFRVGVPSSLRLMFTGLRTALGNAWATLVSAELLAASSGLGYMIQRARTMMRSDLIFVGVIVIGLIGALMSWGLEALEMRLAPWRKDS